jgi:hypothetical protein
VEIAEDRLNIAVFLCVEEKTDAGLEVVPRATVFFVADNTIERPYPVWAVTGRHCIQEARAGGGRMFVRVNAGDSYVDVPTSADDWFEADDSDVACCFWASNEGDVRAMPLSQFVSEDYTYPFGHEMLNPDVPADPIYVGADVFFVGLFSQHAGRSRNLPVARFGNVSRLPRETITVERANQTRERVDGYLVEARSWGGHSGSPAFWAHPITRVDEFMPPDQRNRAERRAQKGPRHPVHISREERFVALLGLVSAHFDIPQEATLEGDILGKVVTKLNSGMAVVTPAHFIKRLIDRDDVREDADTYRQAHDPEQVATMDILDVSPPRVEPKPETEYERFEDLTRKLVQTPKPPRS